MVTEYQSHNGAVNTSTTPSVHYAYSFVTSSGGSNHSRLVSMTYPNGRVLNYNYNSGVDDRISRLSSISDNTGTLEAYSYLGLNTVVTRSHPQTGINQTYVIPGGNSDGGDQYTGLDRFGRVLEEKWFNPNTGTVTDEFLYSYDRDRNRLTSNNALHSYFHETFAYDNLNRLTSFTQGDPAEVQNWTLDAVGNWLSSTTFNGLTDNRTFNNQNQITCNSTAATPTYDADGNTITDDNGIQYFYDAWNRIIKEVACSTMTYYDYDALGRRIRTWNNQSIHAVDDYFSSNWQVVEEDQQGVVQNQFVSSSVYVVALIEQDSGSSRWYAQQDANWNVTAMVASTGSVADRFVYDPYGRLTTYDANWNWALGSPPSTWFYYFQGGRYDATSGLYNFRNRDYSTTLGRWLQQDPPAYNGGDLNLYGYLTENSLQANDPTGLGPTGSAGGSNTPTISDFFGRFIIPTLLLGLKDPCYQLNAGCRLSVTTATDPTNGFRCRVLLNRVLPITSNLTPTYAANANLCQLFGCRCIISNTTNYNRPVNFTLTVTITPFILGLIGQQGFWGIE